MDIFDPVRVGRADERTFTISIPSLEISLPCKATETVLTAIYRAGILPKLWGCRGGGCGVCKIQLHGGQVDKAPMSRDHISIEDEKRGVLLACCIKPRSDLTLDIIS